LTTVHNRINAVEQDKKGTKCSDNCPKRYIQYSYGAETTRK